MTKKLIKHQNMIKEQTKKKMGYLFDDDLPSYKEKSLMPQKTQGITQRNSLFD